ncbi:MAG TPA: EAL domain-containing protein [Rhodocyclaceae bacterium]|nr:EAL domain-containing protein [Rhodocyclaceae bacterium]
MADSPVQPIIRSAQPRVERRRAVSNSLLELQAILDNATVGILFTRNRMLVRCNALCAEMFRYTQEEFLNLPGRAIYPSDEIYESLAAEVGPILAQGQAYRAEVEMRRSDGSLFWCKVSAKAIDPRSPHEGTIWIMEDISDDRMVQDALRQSTAELVSIFESAMVGIAVVRYGRVFRCNARFEELLGHDEHALPGASVRTLFPTDEDFAAARAVFRHSLHRGGTFRQEQQLRRQNGQSFWARISGRAFDPLAVEDGSVWLIEDITDQKMAAVRVQQALDEQHMIFDNAAVGIMFLRDRVLFRCNRKLSEISGYPIDNLIGQSTRIFYFNEDDYLAHQKEFGESINNGGVHVSEIRVRHADGHPIWVRNTGRRADSGRGAAHGDIVWIVEDITERRQAQEALVQAHEMLEQRVVERTAELAEANTQLQEEVFERMRAEQRIWHVAHHDSLTGLPNRALLHDRLAQVLTQAGRNGHRVAVMFLDLDRFKSINDSLGHDVGDELLKSVSVRLQSVVRSVDTVSRLGGDEFVIVLPDIATPDDAGRVAEKIVSVLSPVEKIKGHELRATPSIGIALFPDDGVEAYDLMKNADTAMYHAKSEGRNNYQFFTPHMNELATRFFNLEQRLRAALNSNQFLLHYQPVIHHEKHSVCGFEALVRWRDPELGLISPAEFIPVAEEAGLIIPLGEWVLGEAMRQNREWQQHDLPFLPISVNLSPRQFRHRGLVESVKDALRDSGQPAHLLELEITESALMHDVEEATDKLKELVSMGVRIAIDDFGTGYSSLSHLRRFPVHKLKIDQSFVRDLCSSKDDESIVAAILGLAHSLGLDTVAEGVETVDQLELLIRHACTRFQGYLFSKPVEAAAVPELLVPGRFRI